MKTQSLNANKLEDAIRLIISQCEPHELGQVKLHKALYYADMLTYLKCGKAITGATYRKRPFGPTCDAMLPALAELEAKGDIEVKKVNYFGYEKKEFTQLAPTNMTILDEEEISTLRYVTDFVCKSNTASTISDFPHDIVWESVEMGQDIPYTLALNWIPTSEDEEAKIWAKKEIEAGVTQRRSKEMEGHPFGTLRDRMAARA